MLRVGLHTTINVAEDYQSMGLLPDTSKYGLRMRRECRERFPRHRFQRKPQVSDPDMHHGTCVTHVPWCMSGSLTRGGGENVPGIPGACANLNFTHLVRGPLTESPPPLRESITMMSHQLWGVVFNRTISCWFKSFFITLTMKLSNYFIVGPLRSPHKRPVMQEVFACHGVIIRYPMGLSQYKVAIILPAIINALSL